MTNDKNNIKLIKSSTMKCRLNNSIKSSRINVPADTLGRSIYMREEPEGQLFLMDDFSIIKIPTKDTRYIKKSKYIQRFKTPISVRWDITYQCNFKCLHCYSNCSWEGINTLATKDAKKLLDIFEDGKVQFVQIIGGEPMIRKDIYELIEYALTKKYILSLNSNGYLLNQDVVKHLSDLGLKYIQISLHGFEKEHEYLTTRVGSFKKAINTISLLIDSGISTSVSCVVSDINIQNVILFLDYLIKVGIKNIQLLTPLKEGRAKVQKIKLSKKSSKILKDKLIEFKNNNQHINIDLPGFDVDLIDGLVNEHKNDPQYEFMFGCSGGVSSIRVNPEGKVGICVGNASEPIGDLLKESMTDIMKKTYRWRLKNIPEMCVKCKYYLAECQGGCYLRFK